MSINNLETSLSSLVTVVSPDRPDDPEDIFASAPGFLFTDDLTNSHGAPESIIQYHNKRFGKIELQTADFEGEQERTLFSHYLWNAGLKLGELISHVDQQEDKRWSVEGERIIELGAGVGLGGIVSTLAGAQEVF
jgi:nicotinamide N-methyltransferase